MTKPPCAQQSKTLNVRALSNLGDHGRYKRNTQQDQERSKYALDHESDGNGGRIEDASCARTYALC